MTNTTEQATSLNDPAVMRARIAQLETYETAQLTLAADMDRDGPNLIKEVTGGDRFALAKRFRIAQKSKLEKQEKAE